MIWITGDTHGDFRRFATDSFPQQKQMSRDDYAIIAGDYGGIWDNSPKETYWLNWLEEKPFTTLFVDGNHMVKQRCQFRYWFLGHYHRNCVVDDRFII